MHAKILVEKLEIPKRNGRLILRWILILKYCILSVKHNQVGIKIIVIIVVSLVFYVMTIPDDDDGLL